jgi:hypothetical protein
MRTNTLCDGVGPSRINSWCHPGGEICAFGGAVTVQAVPLHEKCQEYGASAHDVAVSAGHHRDERDAHRLRLALTAP